MSGIYENTDGIRVNVITADAKHNTGTSTESVVIYRVLHVAEGDMGVHVLGSAAFYAMFKSVKWKSDVPVYAILHQELSKPLAAQLADEIEAAIATKYMPPDH